MLGMLALFVVIAGIGNYFQGIGQKKLGSIFMLFFPIALFLAVRLFNKKVNGLNVYDYGFGFNKFTLNSLLGTGLAIVLMAFVLLTANIFFGIQIEFFGLKDNFGEPLISLLMTYLVVGIWEEFYFRGLIFNTLLKNNFGFHSSALISSILFSIIHWTGFDMNITPYSWYIGIVFIGYIFVYIYTYTNSIWSVVFFHFVLDVMLIYLVNDHDNKVGLFEIKNYLEISKIIDNITVVYLGILLTLILFLTRKNGISDNIISYINHVNSTEKNK